MADPGNNKLGSGVAGGDEAGGDRIGRDESGVGEAGSDCRKPGDVEAIGYLKLLRDNRNFRIYWLGEMISLLGDWFNFIASASLLVALTDSGIALGALLAIRMLMPFAVSPFAGVAADRYDRRRLMIASSLARGIVVLGFLAVQDRGDIWLLFALTAIQLAFFGLFQPARSALLPEIVSRRELGAANTLDAVSWSSMLAIGAALGGLVAGRWGVRSAFIVDSASFFVSAAVLSRIVYRPSERLGGDLRAAVSQYFEGWRYLKDRPDVLLTALHKAAFGLTVSGGVSVAIVKLSSEVFVIGKGGSTGLGLSHAAIGIGTGLGPLIGQWWSRDREPRIRVLLSIAYLVSAAGLVGIAWSIALARSQIAPGPIASRLSGPAAAIFEGSGLPPSVAAAFGFYLLFMLLRACGAGSNWVSSAQLLLMRLPSSVRGRVFATEFAIFTLGEATGAIAGGWLLDRKAIDIEGLMILEAWLVLIPAAFWTLWIIRRHRAGRPPSVSIQS